MSSHDDHQLGPTELGAWAPATEQERNAAVRAIDQERDDARGVELLYDLDPLAAELAARAWQHGRDSVLSAIADAIGPSAVTVDPQVLLAAIKKNVDALDFTAPARDAEEFIRSPRRPMHADLRAARLLASVVRRRERMAELEARGGDVA